MSYFSHTHEVSKHCSNMTNVQNIVARMPFAHISFEYEYNRHIYVFCNSNIEYLILVKSFIKSLAVVSRS